MNEKMNENNSKEELPSRLFNIRLSLIEYGSTHTIDEMLTKTLDEAGTLLNSPIGFFCFVQPDQQSFSIQQCSSRTPKEFSRSLQEKAPHVIAKYLGVEDCLVKKQAVIRNTRFSFRTKQGMTGKVGQTERVLVVPVVRQDRTFALLGVGNKPDRYTRRDVEIASFLADVSWEIVRQKRSDESLSRITSALHERVKELSCLYGISKLLEQKNLDLDDIIQKTVDLIPPSWQYPELTCARITLDKRFYQTKHFRKTRWRQSQEIRVNGKRAGILEIYLLENNFDKNEGPFLIEEDKLLDAIAERLGHIIERQQAAEELQLSHDKLQARVQERTKELAAQNRHLVNEIRERKNAEEQLRRSSEKIKLFAYSVAHDLKNPAIATSGLAKILHKKFGHKLDEQGKKICERIQSSAEDIASLAEKINTYISAKETPVNLDKISLKEIFLTLEDEFSSQFTVRSIQWVTPEIFPDIVVADRLSIIRIFRNFIDNSLKYGGKKLGKIEIGYRETKDAHIFTFSDDGQGLQTDNSAHIFNWFKRQKTAKDTQGSGMGLAIVSEFAALHGGEVWLGPAKEKGVSFCVSLSRHLKPPN